MLLGELRGEQKEHEERNDVKWNRLNEKLYVRLLDVNAKRRKENRIYEFILSFIYFQCALRHIFGDPARTHATTNSESRDERKEQGETDTKNKDLNLKTTHAFVNDVDV